MQIIDDEFEQHKHLKLKVGDESLESVMVRYNKLFSSGQSKQRMIPGIIIQVCLLDTC